jgi:DHA2 family multidrug resistance protein
MTEDPTIDGIKHYNPWLVAVVVSLATFMEVLDTTITNVSLSHIAGSLAASPEESTWVLTSYLVANGIVLPLSGWLSGVLGRKRFFLICIAGFTFASLMCGLATSLPMLIAFRLLQGVAGGGLQPTQQAIIMDSFPPEKRGAVFGITGITMIVAPVLGPTLGGWITDNFSWRWIFYINIPVGLLAFLLVSQMVRDPEHAIAKGLKNIDYVGLGFVALGLGALQIVLDKGQQDDWFSSNFITTFAVITVLSLGFAVIWLLRQKDPVVDLTLLKDKSFGLGTILIFITGFVLYSSSALLPILVQTQFGYDALTAGLILSPGAIGVLLLMPVSGQLVSRIPARYMVMFGLFLCGTGCLLTSTHINPDLDYTTFVWLRAVQMMGIPFLFIPVSTLAFMKVPKEKSTKASSLFSLARNLGGSVGIAAVTTIVARSSQTHQSHLVDRLTPGDPVYNSAVQTMTQNGMAHGLTEAAAQSQAMGTVYRELISQSTILAYADTFFVLALLVTAAFAAALFLPMNRPGGKPDPAAAAAH